MGQHSAGPQPPSACPTPSFHAHTPVSLSVPTSDAKKEGNDGLLIVDFGVCSVPVCVCADVCVCA